MFFWKGTTVRIKFLTHAGFFSFRLVTCVSRRYQRLRSALMYAWFFHDRELVLTAGRGGVSSSTEEYRQASRSHRDIWQVGQVEV